MNAAGFLLCITVLAQDSEFNWPQFRGERATGVEEPSHTRTIWSTESGRGIAWTTPIPGLAHSSPIVWGDLLFVSTAVKEEGEADLASLYGSPGYGAGESVESEGVHVFRLYCLNKKSGEIVWQRDAHKGLPKVMRHPKSSHANPTPACDAERVVVSFGSEGIYCFDHAGELLWSRDLGVFDVGAPGHGKEGYQWGVASSPVIYEKRVLLQCDHEGESFVTALDLETGEDVWRTAREEDSTWCTPAVHETSSDGKPQVIVNGYKHIGGYSLESGEEIWSLSGGGDVPVPTPIVSDGLVYLTSSHGRSRPVRAIKVTARGVVTDDPEEDEALVWIHPRRGVYMQTPLAYRGRLYCCSDGGILACYDAKTGEEKYKERLGEGGTGFSGSPVAADGKLYLSGESGEIHVVRAGDELEVLAVNEMGETCMATPAISGGWMYFRTRGNVVAVSEPAPGED